MVEIKIDGMQPSDGPVFSALSKLFAELAAAAKFGVSNPIARDDNPATGLPSAAEVFGVGNGAAASGSASSPSSAPTGAALTANVPVPVGAGAPDPAVIFGGTPPNAAGAATGIPPVPVPASASTLAALQTALPVSAVPVDADGLPWDARIHSSSKGINAGDKKWKAKRNVPDATVAAVTAELRQAMGVQQVIPIAPPAAAPNVPIPAPGAPPSTSAAPSIALPPPTAATPMPAPTGGPKVADVMARVMAATNSGILTADDANQLVANISGGQLTKVVMLAIQPALIPVFWKQLDDMGVA